MAKKEENFELDDFKFDDGVDFPQFGDDGFGFGPSKDTRKPITKLASASLSGAKSYFLSDTFVRDFVKNAMPRGYSTAVDLADESARTLRDLYNSSARELKPLMNDIRRATGKVMPAADKLLPKALSDKLKKFSEDIETGVSQMSPEEQENNQVNMTLASIFKTSVEENAKGRAMDDAKDQLKEEMTSKRHRETLTAMGSNALGISQLVAYKTTVESGYQRKALELQLRSYMLATRAYEDTRQSSAVIIKALDNIQINTSLPDINKYKVRERLKNKFIEKAGDALFSNRGGYVQKLAKGLKDTLYDRFNYQLQQFQDGLTAANTVADTFESMGDMISPIDMAGQVIGGEAANKAGKWVSKKAAAKLSQYDWYNKYVNEKTSNKIQEVTENAPQYLNEWSKSGKDLGELPGKWGKVGKYLDRLGVTELGRQAIDKTETSPDLTVDKVNLKNLQEPTSFSNQNSRSINEIIPGYLARIYRELRVIRTGDDSIELTSFDHERGTFAKESDVLKSVRSKIVDKDSKDYTQRNVDDLLSDLKADSLTAEQRKRLGKVLMDLHTSGAQTNTKALTDEYTFSLAGAGNDSEAFADVFKNTFSAEEDPDGKKILLFRRKMGDMSRTIKDQRATIQNLINAGYGDELQKADVLDKRGETINFDQLVDYNLYGDPAAGVKPKERYALKQKRPLRRANGGEIRGPGHGTSDSILSYLSNGEYVVKNAAAKYYGKGLLDSINQMKLPRFANGGSPTDEQVKKQSLWNRFFKRNANEEAVDEQKNAGVLSSILENVIAIRKQGDEVVAMMKSGQGMGGGGGFGFSISPSLSENWNRVKNWATNKYHAVKGYLGDKYDQLDVWVGKELKPRLMSAKLAAGEYYDEKSKKIIAKWSEITGELKDSEGRIVLDEDSIRRAFLKIGPTSAIALETILKTKDWTINKAKALFNFGRSRGKSLYGFIYDKAMQYRGALKDYLDAPVDVYVGDESKPRLMAISFKGDNYFNSKGKPIHVLSDIDGPVKDAKGNFIISEADLEKGLYDVNGMKIKGGWGQAIEMAKHHYGKLKLRAKALKDKAFDKIKDLYNSVNGTPLAERVRNGVKGLGDKLPDPNRKIINLLIEIRDILKNSQPKKIRKNSIEDMEQKDKEKAKEAAANGTDAMAEKLGTKGGSKSFLGLMAAGLGGLFGKKKKGGSGKDGEDGKDGEKKDGEKISWLDALLGASAVKDLFFGGKRGIARTLLKGGLGLGKQTLKSGWGLTKGLWNVGKWGLGLGAKKAAERGLLGTLFNPAASAGRLAGMAKVGTAIGAPVLKYGTKAVTKALPPAMMSGKVLAGTAKGLGPALLLAGGSALADSTGHHTLAKGLDYGSDALGLYSLFSALSSTGALGSIASGLAALVASPVALGALAVAGIGAGAYFGYKYLTRDKLGPLGKIRYVQYGFDAKKPEHVHYITKMEDRLRKQVKINRGYATVPVSKIPFKELMEDCGVDLSDKTWVSNWMQWFIRRFKPIYLTHLSILDRIKPGVELEDIDGSKLSVAEKKKYLDGAKWSTGPYDVTNSPFKDMPYLPSGAKEVAAAVEEAKKEIEKKPATSKNGKTLAAGAGAAAVAAKGSAAAQLAQAAKKKKSLSKNPLAQPGSTAKPAAGGFAAAAMAPTTDRALVYLTATGGVIVGTGNGRVDALTVIRFKTYGLKAMEADKIDALAKLESVMAKDVTFDASKHAAWKGSPDAVLASVSAAFGVKGGKRADQWKLWFNRRFLPTYLTYVTALSTATGKNNISSPGTLSAKQQVDIATAVYTATVQGSKTSVSVWTMAVSPWKDYDINMDVHSVDANMQALKDQAKAALLTEQQTKSKTLRKQGDNSIDPDSVKNVEDKGAWGNFKDNISNLYENARSNIIGIGNTIKGVYNAAAQAVGLEGGAEITQPGHGTGGDINNIPKPKGQKGVAAFKDTILAAAKMAGVDPNLMMTFAAIESGFDNHGTPGTSSAQGLFQFINSTWAGMLRKYGPKYGIAPQTGRLDARANALMGAEFMKENIARIKKLKGKVTDVDLYAYHLMGPTGAEKFLTAPSNAIPAQFMAKAAAANAPIFGGGKYGPYRTVAQVYQHLTNLVRNKGKQFGLAAGGGSEAVVPSSKAAAKAPTVSSHDNAPTLPSSARQSTPAAAVTPAASAPAANTVAPAGTGDVPQVAQSAKKKRKRLAPVGMDAASTPTPPAPTTSPAPSVQTPVDFGFNPNAQYGDRTRALAARNTANNDQLVKVMSTTNDVLTKSYEEHKAHTELLKQIAETIVGMAKATGTSTAPTAPAQSSAPVDTSWLGGSSLPDLPVSLAKPA